MSDNEIIEAVAKLDGWTWNEHANCLCDPFGRSVGFNHPLVPKYLASRDTIIPCIEKESPHIQIRIINILMGYGTDASLYSPSQVVSCVLLATPRQLAEALLRALNLYEE